MRFILLLGMLCAVFTTIAQPRLLKDINTTPSSYQGSEFISIGDYACFALGDAYGAWWITDGTSTGTYAIDPSGAAKEPEAAAIGMGGNFYYFSVANEKLRLMKYVPEARNLEIVKEFENLKTSLKTFVRGGDKLIFILNSENKAELWESDGTTENTRKFTTIPNQQGVFFRGDDGNTLSYFITMDVTDHVYRLFRTDGTQSGTFELKSSNLYTDQFSELFVSDDEAIFGFTDGGNQHQLWKSDGTSANTVMISPLEFQMNAGNTHKIGSNLIFGAGWFSGFNGIDPADKIFNGYAIGTAIFHGECYFSAYDFDTENYVLGKTDGTLAGTKRLFVLSERMSGPIVYLPSVDKLLIQYDSEEYGFELALTDGTLEGTHIIKDINPGKGDTGTRDSFEAVGDKLVFILGDGVHGGEPWVTDGTAEGTNLIVDTATGTESSGFSTSYELNMHPIGNRLMFEATDFHSMSFWWTDGTEAGTSKIYDFDPNLPSIASWIGNIENEMYFDASAGILSFNTTTGASRVVKSFETNLLTSYNALGNSNLVGGDKLVYSSRREGIDFGNELWVTDGTAEGSHLLKDIYPGSVGTFDASYSHDRGIVIGDKYLFIAREPTYGIEPWITDGTEEGTKILKDLAVGPEYSSVPQTFFSLNGKYYFIALGGASPGSFQNGIWTTDTTPEGTTMIAEIDNSGSFSEGVTNNNIAFFASGGYNTSRLWRTDGTQDGTANIKSFNTDVSINSLIQANNTVYFIADGPNLHELWETDGTEDGTKKVDFGNITIGSNMRNLKNIYGSLYFVTDDGFWKFSGTKETTTKLTDYIPDEYLNVGYVIVFYANSPQYGREPFVVDIPRLHQEITMTPITDKKQGDEDFMLTASADSNLPVTFTATPANRVSIVNNKVKILAPGKVTITANQTGNEYYSSATSISFTICINPLKPVVTIKEDHGTSKILQSSNTQGNQWLSNTIPIPGANEITLDVTETGNYSVTTTVEGCKSEASDVIPVAITGLEDEFADALFPNPAKEKLNIRWGNGSRVNMSVVDSKGITRLTTTFVGDLELNIADYATGLYILKLNTGDKQVVKKFIKQ